MNNNIHKLDPRAGLFLLLVINIVAFKFSSIKVITIIFVFISILMIYFNLFKTLLKFIVFFLILLLLTNVILPKSPKMIAISFSILVNYTQKMLPCFMVGTIMVKKITMQEIIVALRKMHCPEQLIVTLSITLRYFPAIREEIVYIRDAMKLKNMNPIEKISSIIIPLMISATNTAEELSEAAITRGIDNPVKKTSMIDLDLKISDYFITVSAVVIMIGLTIIF